MQNLTKFLKGCIKKRKIAFLLYFKGIGNWPNSKANSKISSIIYGLEIP